MSLHLNPMIWDEFIGSMVALQIEYYFSSLPQPRPQMHITTFPNGTGHLSTLWCTKRVACMGGGHIQFQQNASLRQTDMFRSKCLDLDASIGGQAIFPTLVQDSADTSTEGTSTKGNMGN